MQHMRIVGVSLIAALVLLAGCKGAVGPMGEQGPAGTDGAPGEQGPKGEQGPVGPQGEPPPPPDLAALTEYFHGTWRTIEPDYNWRNDLEAEVISTLTFTKTRAILHVVREDYDLDSDAYPSVSRSNGWEVLDQSTIGKILRYPNNRWNPSYEVYPRYFRIISDAEMQMQDWDWNYSGPLLNYARTDDEFSYIGEFVWSGRFITPDELSFIRTETIEVTASRLTLTVVFNADEGTDVSTVSGTYTHDEAEQFLWVDVDDVIEINSLPGIEIGANGKIGDRLRFAYATAGNDHLALWSTFREEMNYEDGEWTTEWRNPYGTYFRFERVDE